MRSTPEDWFRHFQPDTSGIESRYLAMTPESARPALAAAGLETSGPAIEHESLENRVYGYTRPDGSRIVVKWYRPGRWGRAALEQTAAIFAALEDAGVPAVRPLRLADGGLVGESESMFFTAFAHAEGEEDRYDGWSQADIRAMGRQVAAIHDVTERVPAPDRLTMHPTAWSEGAVRFLEASGLLPDDAASAYADAARALIAAWAPAIESLPFLPVHGDLAVNNLLWTPEAPIVMDLDDASNGPAAQDLSLLHYRINGSGPGTPESRRAHWQLLIEGYRELRPFPQEWLELFEPLRRLRIPAYDAWVAGRMHDPRFREEFPEIFSAEDLLRSARFMRECAAQAG